MRRSSARCSSALALLLLSRIRASQRFYRLPVRQREYSAGNGRQHEQSRTVVPAERYHEPGQSGTHDHDAYGLSWPVKGDSAGRDNHECYHGIRRNKQQTTRNCEASQARPGSQPPSSGSLRCVAFHIPRVVPGRDDKHSEQTCAAPVSAAAYRCRAVVTVPSSTGVT